MWDFVRTGNWAYEEAKRVATIIRALLLYCAGFLVPSAVVLALIASERASDSWSGHDPVNKLLLVPAMALGYGGVFSISLMVARFRGAPYSCHPSARAAILSGTIGGLSLFLLPHATAKWFSGHEIALMIALAVAQSGVVWIHQSRERS